MRGRGDGRRGDGRRGDGENGSSSGTATVRATIVGHQLHGDSLAALPLFSASPLLRISTSPHRSVTPSPGLPVPASLTSRTRSLPSSSHNCRFRPGLVEETDRVEPFQRLNERPGEIQGPDMIKPIAAGEIMNRQSQPPTIHVIQNATHHQAESTDVSSSALRVSGSNDDLSFIPVPPEIGEEIRRMREVSIHGHNNSLHCRLKPRN
jgi:hypothetical protein